MKYLPRLLVFLLFYSAWALADKKEIKIATVQGLPFSEVVDNEFVGTSIEISTLLAESINLKPTFIHCPFARCLSMVQQGEADMILSVKKLPEREVDLIFLHPAYMTQREPLRFFTLASREISITSFDDLNKLIVGTLRGARYFDAFDKSNSITKVELTSHKQLVQMLLHGRIDAFIDRENSILAFSFLADIQEKFALADYQYDVALNAYIAISKHSKIKDYEEPLSKELQKLIANGTINNILMKTASQRKK
ncbi:transporter substrate-binding domain-containing protein [Colwellia sp. 6_MG-2023]|uniref:substrate-binding periplasmic protein n=1 Tax=Colwellia sp. 6_MG-2023 TaxID=3062676 RepID=UPI0026E1DE7A|nr:transporter substrate-binding domain-containing protein [Colwellia sp. 6_MG-2023]MDO6487960.1 transporter substrate-binding domain-containing protein [Colwellia sp. 6_MG-2023]